MTNIIKRRRASEKNEVRELNQIKKQNLFPETKKSLKNTKTKIIFIYSDEPNNNENENENENEKI